MSGMAPDRNQAWRVYLALGLLAVLGTSLVRGGLLEQLAHDLIGLSSAMALVLGVRWLRPPNARPWYLFAAGQLSFVVGDGVRGYDEALLGVEAPLLSLADAFHLLAYPLLAAGLLALVRDRDPRRDRSSLIDALIIAVSVGVVAWLFLMKPYADAPSLSALERLTSIAYPLADLVLAVLVARLAVGPGARTTAYYFLWATVLSLLVADTWGAVMLLDGSYATGSPAATVSLLSYVLLGAAALHPSMRRLSEPAPDPELGIGRGRLALLAGASLLAPAAGMVQALYGHDADLWVTRGATVVLFLLVLMRMSVIVGLLSESLAREREAEGRRRVSEARFRSLVQNSSDVVTVIDAGARVTYQSPSVQGVLGHTPEELVGRRLDELVHPDDVDRVVRVCETLMEGPGSDQARLEFRWADRDGNWVDVEATVRDSLDDPSVEGIVFNMRDVSERKELEEQLTHQAFHDPLTDLANRSLFRDRVEHALSLRRSPDEPVSVLFLDVDNFKTVNDSLGHLAGDQLLLDVAERIRSCLREGDTGARLGGDEFAILLEQGADPTAVANRLLEAFETPFEVHGKEVAASVSIGIAHSKSSPGEGADELLRNADAAMYAAKARGKGVYEFFEQDMHATAMRRLDLERDLRRAIERDELRVHYQAIVGLSTGRITGFEALVRWAHPSRGLLSPAEFIGLAEETGVIVPLGRWVLDEACRQAKVWQAEWPSDPPLTISVNLSAHQLAASDLVADVEAALERSGLAPASLVLEITDSVLMSNTAAAAARLEQLKALGVSLAIDDFGTGFSSLSYLRDLPCDSLKVAKSFLDGVGDGGQGTSLLRAIVELGRILGLTVVAEGVEEQGQWDCLEELSCDLAQGYLFARPETPERVDSLLRRHSVAPDNSEGRAGARDGEGAHGSSVGASDPSAGGGNGTGPLVSSGAGEDGGAALLSPATGSP